MDRWREAASEACDEQRQLRSFARLNRHKEGRERERRNGGCGRRDIAALMYGIMAQCHAHTHTHTWADMGLAWQLHFNIIDMPTAAFLSFLLPSLTLLLSVHVCVWKCTCVCVCLLLRLMINIKPTKRRRTTKCSC